MQYITSPFRPQPRLLVSGTPTYLWGSFNDNTGPTLGKVLSNSATGTTATVVFEILSGNIPIVSTLSVPLVTIVGSANSAGIFNATNATVLTVSTTTAGVCTITFAISSTTQVSTVDGGQVIIPQPEVAEALVTALSSDRVSLPFNNSLSNQSRTITVVCTMPSLPTTATVTLQEAVQDYDSEYQNIATLASVTGGTFSGGQLTIDGTAGRFYRVNNGTVSGGSSPSIITKILI